MKTELTAYKFLSFLLLPVAGLFGISVLLGLLSVLLNPTSIIGVVVIGSIVAYIITTFIFVIKCIETGGDYRPKLVKWIKTTAIVTLVFCVLMISCFLLISADASLLTEMVKQAMLQTTMPPNIDETTLATALREMFTLLMVIGLVLILHIIMSYRIIPRYKNQFPGGKMDIEQ